MRRLWIALAVPAAVALAAAAGIGWLVGTEDGLRWAAARVGGLETEGLRGVLAGEIAAERVVYSGDGARVEARGVRLRAHLAALLGGRLTIDPLHIGGLRIDLREAGQQPSGKPDWPFRLHLANAAIGMLELRRGKTRVALSEIALEHARLGPEVSLAGTFYWPHERFAARAKLVLRGTWERIEAQLGGEVAGIPAEARALLAPFATQRLEAFEARFGPVDLARFDDAAPRTELQASFKGESSAGGALRGSLSVRNAAPGTLDAGRLPVERLEAGFLTDLASARLDRLLLALPGGGTVTGEAELLADRVQAKLIAARVDLRALHARLRRTGLHGPLQVLLERDRQSARGSLTQEGLGFTAELERVGDLIEVRDLRALAEGGELNGTGTIRLGEATTFDAALAIRNFNPAAFGDYPRGSLSGSVDASGRLAPRDIELQWRLERGLLYGHAFQSEGAARLIGTRMTQAEAEVRLGENRLTARGSYGRPDDTLALSLDAPRLEQFAPVGGSLQARGTLTGPLDNPRAALSAEAQDLALPGGVVLGRATAKLSGTLAAHDIALTAAAPPSGLDLAAELRGGWSSSRGWSGEIRSARNAGAYAAEIAAPAPLGVAPRRIAVGRLEARLPTGRVLVEKATWSPGRLASSGEFAGLPAQWLIAAAGLDHRASATLLLDGEWQLSQAAALEGWARVRRSSGDVTFGGNELGIARAAAEAEFSGGRALAKAEVEASLARLVLEGQVLPALDLRGKIEFAELRRLAGTLAGDARLDGRLAAELSASGTLGAPVIHGTLVGEALGLEYPPYGVSLKDGALQAVLEGRSLRIQELTLRGGEGRLTASGTLPLGPEGTSSLAWRADKLSLLDRPDMRLVVSGAGQAAYDGERASLAGELRADRGHFEFTADRLPTLGDDVVIVGAKTPPTAKPRTSTRLPLGLDLQLDMGEQLVVRGYGYDGKVAGRLEVATSKEGELRAYGRLNAVDATFLAYGQRLDVDPGVLIFDGPIDNPSLQITAWRRHQAVEAGVQMTGTARAPILQLVSQPPVPEGERLSWLVLGRAPTTATQADLGLLQAAAGALLSGGDSVPLDRRIARRFGLDELSLRGTGEATDRVVAIGKRLSDRLYVSYEQGLGAVASNLIKLDYALGRRWTLRAETGTSSGGGLFYRYSWD
jgi:translocation and assembly module TamB